ncbi:hypothetical protein J7J00_01660 [Bacillus sp. ISL-4]|uniref:hypothetical protein n=1 Tax=Bacillus sp. ISL-4 TaxID=2819125 RepID=UPI001BE84359|nr:hypothetical protein [Bacillus sp. ISL-4]MBT2664215.1 hypothetical protein [Bacillus sp. ISL-4]MBT2673474.1 hypothetical protein [Streptomyces sp. ISL-14]
MKVQHVDDVRYGAFLQQVGMPGTVVDSLVKTRAAIREGYLDVEDNTLETLLKRPAVTVQEALKSMDK